jgi:hypothetical protein
MFRKFWKTWTIDKPAAFGDLLWEVLVVQLAAWLDRLTLRQVVAFIPVVALIVAYAHQVPVSPALMLLGDLLAYIDIFAVIFLLSIVGRVTTVWLFAKQAADHAMKLASGALVCVRRLDFRRPREGGARSRKRLTGRTKRDDDDPAFGGVAWA